MQTKTYPAILAVVVVGIAGGAYVAVGSGKGQQAAVVETTPTPVAQTETSVTPAPVAAMYKDGTYTATGEYKAPSGVEVITVSLTLKDDMIVDSTVTGTPVNPGSKMNQGKFLSGYKAMITGKSIDEVKLTNVSGSSLTPIGWNAAVETIKAQAKA